MKRTILFTLAISLLPVAAQSQAADVEAIKTNIEQMWKDMAQGKADPNKFDQNHNLTAYSSGGLWEDQTANELATTLVGGGVTLSVKPHHVKVTLLGEKKDVAHATYYLSGKILKGATVAVANYRTRISQVLEKQNGKWIFVANHASPLFGGSGVNFESLIGSTSQ